MMIKFAKTMGIDGEADYCDEYWAREWVIDDLIQINKRMSAGLQWGQTSVSKLVGSVWLAWLATWLSNTFLKLTIYCF